MQITLNQVEIEAALKAYILNQININDGMEIVIDLKATRGEAGTTAIIDIVPRAEEKAEPMATTKVSTPRTTVQPKEKVVAATSMAEVVEKAQAEPEPEKDLPKDDPEPREEAEPEPEVEAEAEAENPEPTTARPSLFKGLGRVKND